jgi:hypothetical protein
VHDKFPFVFLLPEDLFAVSKSLHSAPVIFPANFQYMKPFRIIVTDRRFVRLDRFFTNVPASVAGFGGLEK